MAYYLAITTVAQNLTSLVVDYAIMSDDGPTQVDSGSYSMDFLGTDVVDQDGNALTSDERRMVIYGKLQGVAAEKLAQWDAVDQDAEIVIESLSGYIYPPVEPSSSSIGA